MKKVLYILGGAGILVVSIVLIIALVKKLPPVTKDERNEQLAEETGIVVSELNPSATEPFTRTVSLTSTNTPVPTHTSTPGVLPVASRTKTATASPTVRPTIAANIPPCIRNNPFGTAALVTRVLDEDEIQVEIQGKSYIVRYIGMDTSEKYHKEATQKNTDLVSGKKVTLYKDVSEMDQYDRLLRYVMAGDVFVNYEMVRSGFAGATSMPPDNACDSVIAEVEKEAQVHKVGLWALGIKSLFEGLTSEQEARPNQVVITAIFFHGEVEAESDEYAEITNRGDYPIQLEGWRLLAGESSQDFLFPNFILLPGQTCRVYTDEVHHESCGFSFHSPQAIWDNLTDCGYLYTNTGDVISKFCY